MTRKSVTGIAAAFAVCMLATPAAAGGYYGYQGYDGYQGHNGYNSDYYRSEYYRSYKDTGPGYAEPVYQAPVTVYQAPQVYYPAPTYYTYPAYSYTYSYPDCGCYKRWRKHRRRCW